MNILILAILAGVLGRLGGAGKTGDCWDFARRSWVRDWLIPPLALVALWRFNWWTFLLVWGLMGAAFSTYEDVIFGYDNLWFSGFVVGLSSWPLFFVGIHWYAILLWAFVLAILWGSVERWLPKLWFKDRTVAVEFLRYFSVVATIRILLC